MNNKHTRCETVETKENGLATVERLGFPVLIQASFVLGGWARKAKNKDEFEKLISLGLNASPIHEVQLTWDNQLSPAAMAIFKKFEPFFPPDPWGNPHWVECGLVYSNDWLDMRMSNDREKLEDRMENAIAGYIRTDASIYRKTHGSLENFGHQPYPKIILQWLELLLLLDKLDFQIETGDLD